LQVRAREHRSWGGDPPSLPRSSVLPLSRLAFTVWLPALSQEETPKTGSREESCRCESGSIGAGAGIPPLAPALTRSTAPTFCVSGLAPSRSLEQPTPETANQESSRCERGSIGASELGAPTSAHTSEIPLHYLA